MRRRFDPNERYGLRLTLLAAAVALLAVPFALLLIQIVGKGWFLTVDRSAEKNLHEIFRGSSAWLRTLKIVTFLGSTLWLTIAVTIAAIALWRAHRTRLAVYLVVTSALGAFINWSVKQLVNRARPVFTDPFVVARGRSFPSGHAMSSTVVYGAILIALIVFVPRRWRPVSTGGTILLILAIGFTRIALGVHFLSDVLAGFALGLAWLIASTAAFSAWRAETGANKG